MGIRNFFHKIKIGFKRSFEPSIPTLTEAKKYGELGEDFFSKSIKTRLPECEIKKNVIINTVNGNAEIDCLILYKNKLFAIEVKRWKGELYERDGKFIQYKRDRWTDETHIKHHKSPFKQLGRGVYLLKNQIPEKAWINPVVFFEESDYIETESDNVWFDDMSSLIDYIENGGKASSHNAAKSFFHKCLSADCLYCDSGKAMQCVISDSSLCFSTSSGILTRKDISSISIIHHWSYDILHINTTYGTTETAVCENGAVIVYDNGHSYRYALCKLDHIKLG